MKTKKATQKNTVRLSLDPEQKAELQAAADRAAIPLASWLRMVALAAARGREIPR